MIGAISVTEYTNTTEFCISCHEMEQTVYQEYKRSIHYQNASGVVAGCPDCHVPREWGPKILRKIVASRELYHKVMGTIDTPEKFAEKRLELAERVWLAMEETDSRECRACHQQNHMDAEKQSRRANEKMVPGLEKGKSCIECHKGIAHKNPADEEDDD